MYQTKKERFEQKSKPAKRRTDEPRRPSRNSINDRLEEKRCEAMTSGERRSSIFIPPLIVQERSPPTGSRISTSIQRKSSKSSKSSNPAIFKANGPGGAEPHYPGLDALL